LLTNDGETALGRGALRAALILWRSRERLKMDDRELIAAILTAGILPTLEIPQSRARGRRDLVTSAEGEAIQRAVDHALGLYRLFLNELGAPLDTIMDRPESHGARKDETAS